MTKPTSLGQRKRALQMALDTAHSEYVAANPLSAECHRQRLATMPGGNTRTVLHYAPFPLTFAQGDGVTLWSVDGRSYTDFLGEFTAGLFGHSHQRIRQTLTSTLDQGVTFGGCNVYEERLASLICKRFESVELIRFANSGTEANLLAIATAVAVTGRSTVLVFKGAYHGSVLSFTENGRSMNAPYRFVLGTYNDLQGTRDLIANFRETPAAILVEPMLGAGGCIPGSQAFLRLLREEASRTGAVLIFDEVMTSRLAPGGLQSVHQIAPDLTTFGKYLGGGLSFGAFGGRRMIMEHFDPTHSQFLAHAGTFNNNILAMAAGVTGLQEIFTSEAAVELNQRGELLRARLNELFTQRGVALQVTGCGSVMAIHATRHEIKTPSDLTTADPLVSELLFFDLLSAGFWIARRGMVVLSLPTTTEDCDLLVFALAEVVDRRSTLFASSAVC